MITLLRRSSLFFSNHKPLVDYKQRGQFRSPLELKIGDSINSFQVTHRQSFSDFQIESANLKCNKYGTQWMHLDCEEQKNTFAFVLKCQNAPQAVKMALYKMIQCGSKKFPVRNPIEHMARRSFNPQNYGYVTNDYMFYAFQTSIAQDHKNLMQVFMNMLFDPLFREQDFKQSIWRYELKDPNKLQIKGDTANQMENFSHHSESKIFTAIQKQLFGKEGAGNREDLTKITFENLARWHKRIFHPQNLIIFSHGDMHPAKLISNYKKISQKFDWKVKGQSEQQLKNFQSFQQSKTVKIEHLQLSVPLVLSFKLENVSATDRVLLSILSYLLFDMPDSLFMNWNTPGTPYPKHYGFQGNHFNLAVTIQQKEKPISEIQFLEQQKTIREQLEQIYENKIPNGLIQQCLHHLQSEYYSRDGLHIINGCLDNILQNGPQSLESSLNVKALIAKTLRNFRKNNIFEQLLKKYIIENKKYIRIVGKVNRELIEDREFEESVKLKLILSKMKEEQKLEISSYRGADILQDYRILPKLDISELQIFEQRDPKLFEINSIPIYHCHKCDGIKIVIKYDITDLEEEQIKLIPIICESFPWMGAKGISPEAFNTHVALYIKKMDMKFETTRTNEGMKLYLFLTVEFSQRNAQYGFNICTNLINNHDQSNIEVLSSRIQRKASETYHDITGKLAEVHGRHLASTRSPYAMLQDPIFMARSTCNIASSILKISNPKQALKYLSMQLNQVTKKLKQKNRITVLFECKRQNIEKNKKYLQMMLHPFKQVTKLQIIQQKNFPHSPCLKYFPNYSQEFVFEAFSVPYYNNLRQVPAAMVLSSIVNLNIKRLNPAGGSFLFKGAMISYLRGSRKKVLELEDYYRKIEDIEAAKMFIFQQFRRFTAEDLFYTGVSSEEARNFKQAVAMVDQKNVQDCLQKYILKDLKQGKSSILAIGPHLGNYQPLIKKGWAVERSIEDMSLNMEGELVGTPQIQMSKYMNIY